MRLFYLGITSSRLIFFRCSLHSWIMLLLSSLVRAESGTSSSNDDTMSMLSESPLYGTSMTSYSMPSFVTNSPGWREIWKLYLNNVGWILLRTNQTIHMFIHLFSIPYMLIHTFIGTFIITSFILTIVEFLCWSHHWHWYCTAICCVEGALCSQSRVKRDFPKPMEVKAIQ